MEILEIKILDEVNLLKKRYFEFRMEILKPL